MKRILITGKNSYVGTSFSRGVEDKKADYEVESISVRDESWRSLDFSVYDVVLHVAAVVHKKEKKEMESLYLKINRDLPVEIAKKAKEEGVRQFIFLSTMAVYGEEGRMDLEVVINKNTKPNPKSLYGQSKIEAENLLEELKSKSFKIVVLRPPMIYGPNCPGNYTRLERLAEKTPVFPLIENKRSVLHVNKLSELITRIIEDGSEGLFLPQDDDYINTSILVKNLSEKNGNKVFLSKLMGLSIKVLGNRVNLVNKIFGSLVYEK